MTTVTFSKKQSQMGTWHLSIEIAMTQENLLLKISFLLTLDFAPAILYSAGQTTPTVPQFCSVPRKAPQDLVLMQYSTSPNTVWILFQNSQMAFKARLCWLLCFGSWITFFFFITNLDFLTEKKTFMLGGCGKIQGKKNPLAPVDH